MSQRPSETTLGTVSAPRQRGVSLISLMVGLAISMFAVLGALALYRSAGKAMYDQGGLVRNASIDGQLASGLLSAQMALQGAGYGISNAASGTDLLLLANASFANDRLSGDIRPPSVAGATGNALVWAEQSGGSYRCFALLIDTQNRSVRLLQAANACSPLSGSWNAALNWSSRSLVAPDLLAQAPQLNLRSGAACWPFGALPSTISSVAAPSAPLELRLSYEGSSAGLANTYTLCLANFRS